ncbi:MAG: DUF1015 domain-containing protein [Gaiellales bacterium]|nr:DUF1015 domain-containing protein [Gaiellales bacterium]
MAEVVPFRPWLYNTAVTGPLAQALAPPYDVIGRDLQDRLYAAGPHNVVRIDLNRDPDPASRYASAAATLQSWKTQQALVQPPEPSVTVLEHAFVGPDGLQRMRTGMLACVKLAEFGEGVIFPHEYTLSGPKEDRFRLMTATGMALSPVFLLYSHRNPAVAAALRATVSREPDESATAPGEAAGRPPEQLRLWRATDHALHHALATSLSDEPLVIADGHHRYETALRYRAWRRSACNGEGGAERQAAWEYFLAYLVGTDDPGLAIFATHRLVRGLPQEQVSALPQVLAGSFRVEELPGAREDAPQSIRRFLEAHLQGPSAFGLYLPDSGRSYGLLLSVDPATAASDGTDGPTADALSLDVSVLQNLVLNPALGITADRVAGGDHVVFVKEWAEGFALLEQGECQAGFFLNPTRLNQVTGMALRGERMPQKSTYFYPKIPTGLVFLDLNGSL